MNKIPFVSVERENKYLEKLIVKQIKATINSGQYILGGEVKSFENDFAKYCGVKYACGVGNGYDGLFLSIKALNIKNDDEVLVPTNSFIASALSISNAGAKPVFIDCLSDGSYSLCLESAAAKLTKKTKAIMVVHLYGIPAEMKSILAFAKKNGLYVIEDCAQAHGAMTQNKRVGSFGDVGVFSFYPTKNLGALGDGGCVVSKNYKLIENIRKLSNYGSKKKYGHTIKGFNSRLDTIQASILRIKLKKLDGWNEKRRKIASLYINELKRYPDIALPKQEAKTNAVWHLFVIRYMGNDYRNFVKFLNDNGVSTSIHYPIPIHRTKAYGLGLKLVNSEKFSKQYISLPIHPFLRMTEILNVIKVIRKFLLNKR